MKWQQIICKAIADRSVLRMLYDDNIWRTIEPHTFGINTNGNLAVRAFRIAKDGSPSELPDWRVYLNSKIVHIRESGDQFMAARPGYSATPTEFSKIVSKL